MCSLRRVCTFHPASESDLLTHTTKIIFSIVTFIMCIKQLIPGKEKDNYRFTPEIHTGYFLPGCSSHLKSLVANWIPSTAESKWSFCNKRKKRFSWNTTIAQTLIVANLTFGLKSSSIWDLQSLFLFHTQLLAPFGITEKEQREKQKIENAGEKNQKWKENGKKEENLDVRSRASKVLAISRLKKLKKIRRRLTQWTLFFIIIIILIFISYLIFPLPRSYLLFPVTPTGNYALYLSFRPCFPGKLYKG